MRTCNKCGLEMKQQAAGRWRCPPCDNAYQRSIYEKDAEKIRKRKRESMRRARADPVRREHMNAQRRGNPIYLLKGREYTKKLKQHHFFRWRARLMNSRSGPVVTATALASLWKKQRGRCELSGRKLGRDAHVDHIKPVSKGGDTAIENLRWLDPWVNLALREHTDEEFIDLCSQITDWIGKRILEVASPKSFE